jgi:hypothetical protein
MALLETQSGLAGQYGYANGAPILNASVARDLLGNELSKPLDIERNELGWGTNSKYLGKIYTGAGLYGIDMPRAELDQLLSVGDQAKRDFAAGKIQQMIDTDTNQIYYTETDPDKGFGNSVQRFATDETNAFENFNKWVDATNKLSNAAQSLGIDTRGMTDRQILDAVNARDTRIAVTGRTQFWDANQAGIGGTEGPQHATVVYTQQNGKLVPVASPKTFEFQDPNTNKGFFGDLFENIIDVISIPPIAAALGAYAFGPGGLLSSAGEAAASAAGGGAAELASVGATGYGLTGPIVATPGLLETIQNVSNVIPTPGTSVSAPATQIVTPIAPSVIPTAAEIATQADLLGIGAGVGPGVAAPVVTAADLGIGAGVGPGFTTVEPGTGLGFPTSAEIATQADALGIGTGVGPGIAPVAGAGAGPAAASSANVFEYGFQEPLTPFNPVSVDVIPASNVRPTDVLRAANTLQQLTQQPQQQAPQTPEQTGQSGPLGVDYSQLLNLLANQARTTGLLGTRFQPTPVNLSSLLG